MLDRVPGCPYDSTIAEPNIGSSDVQSLQSLARLQAILEMVAAMTKDIGNFGPMPGIFPDYSAPILRAQADGS